MLARDYRDILAGLFLIAVGAFVAFYSAMQYNLGTINRMGPGMFPMGLGVILCIFGVLVFVPALFRKGDLPKIEFRSAAAVLGSVAAFASMVDPFGLIPAITLLTIVAALGDNKLGVVNVLLLAAGLSLMSVLVFSVGLGMSVKLMNWPF